MGGRMSRILKWFKEPVHAAAAGLMGLYLVVQLAGLTSMGLTDDDDFYIPAGISYARWLGDVVTFESKAWSRAAIDAAFGPNHEHPPIAKYVFGICHFAFRGLLGPTDSARVGTVLFSTLAAALLLVLALSHLGPRRGLIAGGFAVMFLLTLPRFYFHSHAATLDVPVATMYLAAATLALLGERSRSAALWAGVVFGLATATKLNGPFLIAPYLLFVVLVRWRQTRSETVAVAGQVRLPPVPLALISMVGIGPLVFFASWPWMWFDTINRVKEYVAFHLNHYGIYFLYFGRLYDKDPFAPWHAPFTMAAITVPVAVSVLALIGIGLGASRIASRIAARDSVDSEQGERGAASEDGESGSAGPADRREGDLVLTAVLHAVVSVAVVAASGGPKYGGAKLFMPFFPFWCLLAGYGVMRLIEGFQTTTMGLRAVPVAAGVLAVVASAGQQLRFGGYALSQYNALAGGLRGATATGFERQYYDIAFRDLVGWLNEHAPPKAKVHFLPNNWEYVRTYRWYRKGGELRSDITVVNAPTTAQLLVLTHERRFQRYGGDLQRYRTRPVLTEQVIDGVPIWTVFDLRRR